MTGAVPPSSDTLRIFTARLENVRQLQNRAQRAVIMAECKRVTTNELVLTDTLRAFVAADLEGASESAEREIVQDALRGIGGKFTSATLELVPADRRFT